MRPVGCIPTIGIVAVDFRQNRSDVFRQLPVGIMRLEFRYIADIPNVITGTIGLLVGVVEFLARDLFAQLNRLEHGAVAKSGTSDVVNLSASRIAIKMIERLDKIVAMNVVPYLFTFVPKDSVGIPRHRAFHQIRQETMQLRATMVRPRQASSSKRRRAHGKVSSILLYQHIGGNLRCSEQAMRALIDRHILTNTLSVGMVWVDLPPQFVLDQRQFVRAIPVDFVR